MAFSVVFTTREEIPHCSIDRIDDEVYKINRQMDSIWVEISMLCAQTPPPFAKSPESDKEYPYTEFLKDRLEYLRGELEDLHTRRVKLWQAQDVRLLEPENITEG